MIEISVLVDKLNGMDCGQEVRDFLASQGIKGIPQVSHECPIANWIHQQSGRNVTVEETVCDQDAAWEMDCDGLQTRPRYRLESAPISFIRGFDAGLYPELVIPGASIPGVSVEDDDCTLQDDYASVDDV